MKIRTFLLFTFLFIFLGLFLIPAIAVSAQQPTPSDDEVNAIARQLYCPVCENTPLDVCPTQACAQWRDLIRQMLAEGKSAEEIKQYFVENYGARVLSEPPLQGFNWLAYIVLPIIIIAWAYIAFRVQLIPRIISGVYGHFHHKVEQDEDPGMEAPTDEYVARLEEELRKRG